MMGAMNEQPPHRLDRIMNVRRLDLDLDWKDVADAAGIAIQTLDAVRKGKNRPTERTQRRIERALQWAPGSIDAVLAGGDPTPIDDGHQPDLHAVPNADDERLDRLEEELRAVVALLQRIEEGLAEVRRDRERDTGSHDRHGVG